MNGAPGKDANFLGPSYGHGGAGWQQSSSTAKSFVKGGSGGECEEEDSLEEVADEVGVVVAATSEQMETMSLKK